MEAFNRLHAAAVGTQTTCSNRGGCSSTQYLVLADGSEIWHPEDLAPVVAPQSEAGASMRRLLQLQERAWFWRKVMLVPMGVGIAFAVAAIATESAPLGWSALGLIGGGFVVGGAGVIVSNFRIRKATYQLFEQYDGGLAAQLNICARGMAVVPCDAPDTPTPPDPVLRSLPQR